MARRRVNRKFLITLLAVVGGGAAAIFIASNVLIRDHPDRYVSLGDQAMSDGKYEDAVAYYQRAGQLSAQDPKIQMDMAAAFHQLGPLEPDMYAQERQVYLHTLELDPRYMPAIRSLLDIDQLFIASTPNPAIYSEMITYAQRGHDIDPGDKKMAALAPMLVAQKWIANLGTDQQEIRDAMTQLRALAKSDPSDSLVPFCIAQVNARQAEGIKRQNPTSEQPQAATDLYTECRTLFQYAIDPKGGAQQDSPDVHYRYAQLLAFLSGADQSVQGNPKTDMGASWDQINQARKLADPKSMYYLDINELAAQLAEQRKDHQAAVDIYRAMPDNPTSRLHLADTLGMVPDTRAEGETLLKSELDSFHGESSNNRLSGLRIIFMQHWADLKIADYADPKLTAEKKKEIHDEIQDTLDKINTAMGSRSIMEIKRLNARFQFAGGDFDGTIKTLTALMADDAEAARDPICLTLLASAYVQTKQQTGEAIDVLRKMEQINPMDVRARKQLVRLLVLTRSSEALGELDALEKIDPNDPDVNLMRVALQANNNAAPANNAAAVANYKQLPETKPAEVFTKAQAAFALHIWDEAVRLYSLHIQQVPDDAMGYLQLSKVYYDTGDKEKAVETAQNGLKEAPDSQDLKLLLVRINGGATEDVVKDIKDPVERDLKEAQLADGRKDLAAEESYLKDAEAKAGADDQPRVWDLLFTYYVNNGRPNDAQAYLPKLTAIDKDSAGGRMYQLRLAQARGQRDKAMDIVQSLLSDRGDYATTWVAYGDVLFAQGRTEQAVSEYEVALQRQPNTLQAYLGLIRCEYALSRPNNAQQFINDGLKVIPGDPTLRDMLVTHELTYGDPMDAIKTIAAELHADPESQKLNVALVEVYLRVARVKAAAGDQPTALQVLHDAVDRINKFIAKWPDNENFYLTLSEAYQMLGQPADAEKALQALAAQDKWKDQPFAYAKLGEFYEKMNQPDKAEAEMKQALDISHHRLDAIVEYVGLLGQHGKYDQALALLGAPNSDQETIRELRIQILGSDKKMDDARAEFTTDLVKYPEFAAPLHSVWARALLDNKQYTEAADQASQCLAVDSSNREALFTRGYCRLYMIPPDPKGAAEDLVLYLQMAPGEARGYQTLGMAQVALNNNDDAILQFERVMQIEPTNKFARLELVSLLSGGEHPRSMDALAYLKQVDGAPPFSDDPETFRAEAIVYRQLNDLNDATAAAAKAHTLRPEDDQVAVLYLDLLQQAQANQKLVDESSGLPDKLKGQWWALYRRAHAELSLANQQAALADANASMTAAIGTKDDEAIMQDAQQVAQFLGADQAIAIVQPHAQDNLAGRLALAVLLHSKGADDQAVAALAPAISSYPQLSIPQQINVASTAAQIYQTVKPQPMVAQSLDAYQKWVKLQPGNIIALNNLSWLLVENFNPPRVNDAMQYIEQAMATQPPGKMDLNLEDTHGWLQILGGDVTHGVQELNQVVDVRPSPETYLHLADGYLRLQLVKEAVSSAQSGIDAYNKQDPKAQDPALLAKLKDMQGKAGQALKARQSAQAQ